MPLTLIRPSLLPPLPWGLQPVREVTLSIWKAMLHLRRAWLAQPWLSRGGSGGGGDASSVLGGDRCPSWDDPAALEYWVRAWAAGGPSGPAGDTLHRCSFWGCCCCCCCCFSNFLGIGIVCLLPENVFLRRRCCRRGVVFPNFSWGMFFVAVVLLEAWNKFHLYLSPPIKSPG